MTRSWMINKERSFEETKFEYHIKSGEGKEKFQLSTTNERLEWEEEDRIGDWRRKDQLEEKKNTKFE